MTFDDQQAALLEQAHRAQRDLERAALANAQRRRQAVRAAWDAGIPQNIIARHMRITPTSVNRIIKGAQ